MLLLAEPEIRQIVRLDAKSLAAIEAAFVRLSRGEVTVPAPMDYYFPERRGEVHIKSAHVQGMKNYALKIASGFYENSRLGLQNSSGMVIVLSAETGYPQALLMDNGYLTDVRTAMAGAIAAKYLAKQRVATVGIIGVGIQARFQLEALRTVRKFERVLVYGRKQEAVKAYCTEMMAACGVPVSPAVSVSELVRLSDLVVTTTPSREPLVMAEDVHPGLHITAMGADLAGKQELQPQVLARADRIACDLESQCRRVGELQHAAGVAHVAELGQIISGAEPGRQNDNEITVCDLTGIGVQDAAIANLAHEDAVAQNIGQTLTSAH